MYARMFNQVMERNIERTRHNDILSEFRVTVAK